MKIYADTSFVISLYAPDVNSSHASKAMEQAAVPVLITQIGELELVNALYLRVYRKELDLSAVSNARAWLRKDMEEGLFALSPVSARSYEKAKQIARHRTPQLGGRSLDALHIASALVSQADTFYSFDAKQNRMASAEGLKIL